jgi:hypothetical protein
LREVIMALVEDPWQARLNRMRRLLPLPMLALSAAITFAVPASAFHRWARFELGLPLNSGASRNGASPNGASPNGGYGLTGMEQRLARIGGTLTIESAPGSGTTLNAAVPLTGSRPGDPP